MKHAAPTPDVIYVLSPPHSGSTLLDLLLGSHGSVTSGGELKALRGGRATPPRDVHSPESAKLLENRCACGTKPARRCAYWSAVARELSAEGLDLETLDAEAPDDGEFAQVNRSLFRTMAKIAGTRFVVDSSKSLKRFGRLRQVSGLSVYAIVVVRDPRGVAWSGMRKGRRWFREAADYGRYFSSLRPILRDDPPSIVRYEDLCRRPSEVLDRLLRRLGLALEEGQLDWRSHAHHNFAGNRMRYAPSSEIRLDESWRNGLTPIAQAGVLLAVSPSRWWRLVR